MKIGRSDIPCVSAKTAGLFSRQSAKSEINASLLIGRRIILFWMRDSPAGILLIQNRARSLVSFWFALRSFRRKQGDLRVISFLEIVVFFSARKKFHLDFEFWN